MFSAATLLDSFDLSGAGRGGTAGREGGQSESEEEVDVSDTEESSLEEETSQDDLMSGDDSLSPELGVNTAAGGGINLEQRFEDVAVVSDHGGKHSDASVRRNYARTLVGDEDGDIRSTEARAAIRVAERSTVRIDVMKPASGVIILDEDEPVPTDGAGVAGVTGLAVEETVVEEGNDANVTVASLKRKAVDEAGPSKRRRVEEEVEEDVEEEVEEEDEEEVEEEQVVVEEESGAG